MAETPASLLALWELADELGDRALTDPLYVLDPVGLLLVRPLERWDYDRTPLNSLTFAQTGEEGVHFGLLELEDADLASAPVVMTVPDAGDESNIVIAGDFDEFLAIGAISGWFVLGRLAEEPDDALERLATPDPDPWAESEQLLAQIREALSIEPAPLTHKRLEELRLKYGTAVIVEDDGAG